MKIVLPMVGAHAVTSVFVHVVWSTHDRLARLAPEGDASLVAILRRSAATIRVALVSAGVADDHVHGLVQLPADVSVAKAVQQVKGASSHALGRGRFGGWQTGYWAESISTERIERAAAYVAHQRAHHASVFEHEPWEQTAQSEGTRLPIAALGQGARCR